MCSLAPSCGAQERRIPTRLWRFLYPATDSPLPPSRLPGQPPAWFVPSNWAPCGCMPKQRIRRSCPPPRRTTTAHSLVCCHDGCRFAYSHFTSMPEIPLRASGHITADLAAITTMMYSLLPYTPGARGLLNRFTARWFKQATCSRRLESCRVFASWRRLLSVSLWIIWSGRRDLNSGPLAPQAALPNARKLPIFRCLQIKGLPCPVEFSWDPNKRWGINLYKSIYIWEFGFCWLKLRGLASRLRRHYRSKSARMPVYWTWDVCHEDAYLQCVGTHRTSLSLSPHQGAMSPTVQPIAGLANTL